MVKELYFNSLPQEMLIRSSGGTIFYSEHKCNSPVFMTWHVRQRLGAKYWFGGAGNNIRQLNMRVCCGVIIWIYSDIKPPPSGGGLK